MSRLTQSFLIDVENAAYQLLLFFGCDLNAPINHKYDAFRLGLAFLFACFMIYWILKYLYVATSNFFRGRF